MDNLDQCAVQIYLRDDGGIQAYLRVIEPGKAGEDVVIGRVLSKKRRCGLGAEIVSAGIEVAKSRMHASKIRIAAQTYVRSLYENIGFKQSSEEFMEDGIPHIEMILSIDQKNLVQIRGAGYRSDLQHHPIGETGCPAVGRATPSVDF